MSRLITALTLIASCALAQSPANGPREIFYAPFDGSPDAVVARGQAKPYQVNVKAVDKGGYIDGKVGKAVVSDVIYNGIRWDGCGNIDLERGTLALWYCPMNEPNVAQRDSLFGVSTDIEGYWAGIVNFLNRKTQGRDAKSEFVLHFYDMNRYSPDLKFQPIFGRWHKGEWHHIAMVWDRNLGITIYEDGKRQDSNWGKYRWEWNFPPRMLVLGNWQYSTTPFAADEFRIYSDCLTDAQVAQLARCEKPTGAPIPRLPADETRAADLARMGWPPQQIAAIPATVPGKPLRLTFSRIAQCIDAKRFVAQPFEGLTGSCWPIQKYGASTAGSELEVSFAPDQSFDRVRIFSHGPFAGRLRTTGPDGREIMAIDSRNPVWQGRFGALRNDARLLLRRDAGATGVTDFQRSLGRNPQSIGQIDFYRAETVQGIPRDLRTYACFERLDRLPDTLAARAALGETPVHFDNPVRATTTRVERWRNATPAFGGFQLITETLTDPVAMDGVVLELVVEGLARPTPVHVAVKEPVFPQRDWLAADVVLTPDGPGRQIFTLHLTGRPVISFPRTEMQLPSRDAKKPGRVLSDPGREIAVLVTAADPITWLMGEEGCALALCLTDTAEALPAAVADQTEFAREAYAEHNEGHIWDVIAPPGWGRLYYPLLWLMRFAPDARPTQQLALRVGYRFDPVACTEPANPTGAPEWAFWQRQAFNDCRRILAWIVDNRQVETGEFGGVWGDDTDMTEYWPQFVLAGDDDRKIGDALRRFYPGLYRHCLKDGVSEAVRDNLHSYEEGMGSVAYQLLLDYGDPGAFERAMRASSHYDKWMARNPDGTCRFLGNYLGWDGVWTEGAFGRDEGRNGLMLIPAAYLLWYNRHPAVVAYIRDWTLSLNSVGIVQDAALRLKGDRDFMRKWYDEAAEKAIRDGRYFHAINCLIDKAGGVREDLKPRLKSAANGVFNFISTMALPEYAGYSPSMTEAFWMMYKATGDVAWLTASYKQACRFINNQDWLYTVAEPSTDRIPLPDTSVVRARIGAFITERGGHVSTWPLHAISYLAGADRIAALVTENTDTSLAVRLYNFDDAGLVLKTRLWRLLPGIYDLRLSNDKDDDGKPEEPIEQRRIDVDRGCYLDLKLPPRRCMILELRAVETHEPVYDLPDPALGHGDVWRAPDGRIMIAVHNIGTKPVENLPVRVTAASGLLISEQTIALIPPPLDLREKIVIVAVPNLLNVTAQKLTITLDPDRQRPDLNRYNNTLEFRE